MPPPPSPPRTSLPSASPHRAMAAMASGGSGGEDTTHNRRSASIANLLLPSSSDQPPPQSSLLSLSHLAASMQPASPADVSAVSHRISRTRSVPPQAMYREHLPDALPPDARAHRQSRFMGSANLGVAHGSAKRLSRTKSGFAVKAGLRAAAAAAAASARDSNRPRSPAMHSQAQPHIASPATPQRQPPRGSGASPLPDMGMSPLPSPTVLRPISSNPMAGYASKHTSASNSVESCVPADGGKGTSPALQGIGSARKELFQHAAQRFSSIDFASNALARMRNHGRMPVANDGMMDVDAEYEQREPSSSSHDAKLARGASRSRTTPDAKRAQNRESAKRFRVAQKKRWAELQETVERKDEEISRLKDMLQEVTNQNLASRSRPHTKKLPSLAHEKADSLTIAELGLFVKLMCSPNTPDAERVKREEKAIVPPIAANIGTFYRVIVAKLDGSVLGNRHVNDTCGKAMGGEVGGVIWEHVHSSDSAHLRFTVVHAAKMASVMNGEPTVFSYRRRELIVKYEEDKLEQGQEREKYMRMKGCLYPMADEYGDVTQVLLAEFIEI